MSIFFGLFAGNRPDNLGIKEGRLSPCPDTPNCVCSQDEKSLPGAIMPLPFLHTVENTFKLILAYIYQQDQMTVITETDNYLHIECKSRFFGFVDDLEIYCDQVNEVTHVRSASRIGHSDLGANRKRVEALRDFLIAKT